MKAGKRQWITALALGLTIVLLVACGPKETPAPAPTKAPAATEAPAATKAPAATEGAAATEAPAASPEDAKSVIIKSAVDLKNLKSYRSKIWQEEKGETGAVLSEHVMPDRHRTVHPDSETIIIGDDMYTKTGDTWTKMTEEGLGAAYAKVYVTEENVVEPRLEGTEDVDGVPCWKYVYTTKVGDTPPYEATVWIGVEDGLPYKQITKPQPDMTMIVTFYDFNTDITIEPPVTGEAEAPSTAPQPTAPPAEAPQSPETGAVSHDTVFPLPDNVQNFMGEGGESQVNFQTSLSLEEVIEFYRQALAEKGLTESVGHTATTDTTFSMVFLGWPNGRALVIQGVDLGASRNVNIRFEDL
jgi:hypothetical protein